MRTYLLFALLGFGSSQNIFAQHEHHHHPTAEPKPATKTIAEPLSPQDILPAQPEHTHSFPMRAEDCSEMEVYEFTKSMCMPRAMPGMPMSMLMMHGNGFLAGIHESGPRGRDALASPNMVMLNWGTSVGDTHYWNLEFMGTAERWTMPEKGYPLLFQVGEENASGVPYLDAQHPHSSPIMGLVLSDTISLGSEKNYLKVFAGPRGASTDGPIAFMHRPTGMMNPDAPLGHHVGQDVGHLTSSVVGASLSIASTVLEASLFNGREPSPSKVDLPVGPLNSYAMRLVQEFNPEITGMVSYARVHSPEHDDPATKFVERFSASLYRTLHLGNGWTFDNALIYGAVTHYDHAVLLQSVLGEVLFMNPQHRFWSRIEGVQRTPKELSVLTTSDPDKGEWVGTVTVGYTQRVVAWTSANLALGGSLTTHALPAEYRDAYGAGPWAAKIFLQLSGMKMWDL